MTHPSFCFSHLNHKRGCPILDAASSRQGWDTTIVSPLCLFFPSWPANLSWAAQVSLTPGVETWRFKTSYATANRLRQTTAPVPPGTQAIANATHEASHGKRRTGSFLTQ